MKNLKRLYEVGVQLENEPPPKKKFRSNVRKAYLVSVEKDFKFAKIRDVKKALEKILKKKLSDEEFAKIVRFEFDRYDVSGDGGGSQKSNIRVVRQAWSIIRVLAKPGSEFV